MRRRPRRSPPPPVPSPAAVPPAPGPEIHGDGLTVGVHLDAGAIVVRLTGTLDRPGRATLLRVVGRAVRSGDGEVVVDCAGLTGHDDAGIDALAALVHLPGVRSVHLRHVAPDLGHRLDEAGLAPRLHLPAPAAALTR